MTVYAHTEVHRASLEEVPVTIKITLAWGTWAQFAGMISAERWPASDVHRAINDAIKKIEAALEQCGAGPMREES